MILGGYSQGAQAIADGIQGKADSLGDTMDTSALLGAVFFGDPYFNPQSDADHGDFDPGRWGLLGIRPEYASDLLFPERRIHSWCRNKDPICQGLYSSSLLAFPDFDKNRHKVYRTEGSTAAAANVIENLIRDDQATRGNPLPAPVPPGLSGPLDVAFAIDSTGSMGDIIDSVKTDVTNIVAQLGALDPDYRVALVDYKDALPYGDDPYQAQVDQDFTTDTGAFDTAVSALSASGGGDDPESVYTGMMTALNLSWRTGAHKVLIAIGDAGGHPTDPVTGFTAADVVARALSLDPVSVYGLVAHDSSDAAATFDELATGTGGAQLPIASAADVPTTIEQAVAQSATAPVAAAGGPYTGYVGSPTLLSGAASASPVGRGLVYEWDTNNDGVFDLTTTSPVASFTWTAPYSGIVTLRVSDGMGLSALAQTQVVIDGSAPAAPLSPSAPVATAGDGQVVATWQPPSGGGSPSYYVLRYAGAADPVAYVLATGGGAQSATLGGLPNGIPVTLNVTAVNPSGVSAPSANSNAVTPGTGGTNHPPVAGPDRAGAVAGGKAVVVNVLANDRDPDGDTLATTGSHLASGPGSIALVGGSLRYTPPKRDIPKTETATATYTVSDPQHASATATVTITVSPSPLVLAITKTSVGRKPPSLDVAGRISARAGASLRCSEPLAVTLGGVDVTAARGRSTNGTCLWRSGSLHSANVLVGRWSARTHRFEIHLSGAAPRRLPPRATTVGLVVRIGDDAGRTAIHLVRTAPGVKLVLKSRIVEANGKLRLEIGCPAGVRSACTGTLTLSVAGDLTAQSAAASSPPRTTIARGAYRVGHGRTTALALQLTDAGLALLDRNRVLTVRLVVSTRVRGYGPHRATHTFRLRSAGGT